MKIKVFKVFHRAIDERLILDRFTPAEVEEHFTLYGVNGAKAEKFVTKLDGVTRRAGPDVSNLVLEYQMPWHDETVQARGFMEGSCYVHLYKNAIHESLDYVGVAQYDMRWPQQSAELLREMIRTPAADSKIVYAMLFGMLMDNRGAMNQLAFPQLCDWDFLLKSYNKFFNGKWDKRMLAGRPLTLCQTYLMPRREFAFMASWLNVLRDELYPWANQPPFPAHWGHLAGVIERAESLYIAARLAEREIELRPWELDHDESIAQKLTVSRDHYGEKRP